jgi:hypothetical protein
MDPAHTMETAGFSHGESKRLVIEAPWLVNGGHGASLNRHHLTAGSPEEPAGVAVGGRRQRAAASACTQAE